MIFWEQLKIKNATKSATISLPTSGAVTFDQPVSVPTITITNPMTIPAGSSFGGSVTLPSGTAFAGSVTLPAGSSVASALTYNDSQYNLNVANITTDTITADVANINAINLVEPVRLPAGSSINGSFIRPGPVQENSLFIDGHFGDNKDWLSITNYSTTAIYTRTQLFTDAACTNPYVLESGSFVIHDDFIAPGKTVRVLDFYDDREDPAQNAYIGIQYHTSTLDSWQNINGGSFQGKDVTGYDKQVYRTYGTPSQTADWFRTLLYADDNEYWFIFSLPYSSNTNGGLNAFRTMVQTMYNQGYRFVSTHRYPSAWITITSPVTENNISDYYCVGGTIGFAKQLKNN